MLISFMFPGKALKKVCMIKVCHDQLTEKVIVLIINSHWQHVIRFVCQDYDEKYASISKDVKEVINVSEFEFVKP